MCKYIGFPGMKGKRQNISRAFCIKRGKREWIFKKNPQFYAEFLDFLQGVLRKKYFSG